MPKPKYQLGEIIRYGGAPSDMIEITEIIRVDKTPPFHHKFKYNGIHPYGRTIGVFEKEAKKATIQDVAAYKKERRK